MPTAFSSNVLPRHTAATTAFTSEAVSPGCSFRNASTIPRRWGTERPSTGCGDPRYRWRSGRSRPESARIRRTIAAFSRANASVNRVVHVRVPFNVPRTIKTTKKGL